MGKLVARLLATAAVWVRIQTYLKEIQNGRKKQRSGQHTLARQQNIQKQIMVPAFRPPGDDFSLQIIVRVKGSQRLNFDRYTSDILN
jgi:hypothetical protein